MKLGTKIILGFVVVCVIFIIIAGVNGISLRRVQDDTHLLRDQVMPLSDKASNLQFNVMLQGIKTIEYSYTYDDEDWKQAQQYETESRNLIS
ncbi:MAG: MCP four helix bundle domain-containing protein, partial [Deltaproteobacteria bacterium]|nr:MCP four helix bundle domain-containing protein [Deltaproteobacteria bacterium]